jgi:hypothetical protein
MADKLFRFGPVALANAAANIFNPPTGAGGVGVTATNQYAKITHIRVVNKTAGAATFSLFIGATGGSAAGTEFMGSAKNVPANDSVDWNGSVRLDIADFLTGLASAAATLTIEGEGVLMVV